MMGKNPAEAPRGLITELRAILKATDMYALEPSRVAQVLVIKGVTTSYDHTLRTLQELLVRHVANIQPGGHRALLRPAPPRGGADQGTPQIIIAQGTDWRFLNELKKELKG